MKLTAKQHENIARGMRNVYKAGQCALFFKRTHTETGSLYSKRFKK